MNGNAPPTVMGAIAVVMGLLFLVFRSKVRYFGPTGMRPMAETEPTGNWGQVIVLAIGTLFILGGVYFILVEPLNLPY